MRDCGRLAAVEEAAWMAADDPLPVIGMRLIGCNARRVVGSRH
jgi:hypothetical protein